MSAYLVSKAHIDVLVDAAMRVPYSGFCAGLHWRGRIEDRNAVFSFEARDLQTAHVVGRHLWLANLASVQALYPDEADGQWPGPPGLTMDTLRAYRFARPPVSLPPVAILKALAGYRAQCTADPH